MFQTTPCTDGSRKYSSKYISNILVAAMLLAFNGSCAEGASMNSCSYIDAFGSDVELNDLTVSKAHLDAKKFIMEGRIALMGGYLETGSLTIPLRQSPENYPLDKIQHLAERFGIEKIEKIYPTKKIELMKRGDILHIDDGFSNGKQVEIDCYNADVRSYAIEFNNVMFSEALKD